LKFGSENQLIVHNCLIGLNEKTPVFFIFFKANLKKQLTQQKSHSSLPLKNVLWSKK